MGLTPTDMLCRVWMGNGETAILRSIGTIWLTVSFAFRVSANIRYIWYCGAWLWRRQCSVSLDNWGGTVLLFQIRERRDVHRDGEECAYCSCLDALCALSAVYAFDDVSA